ncbi:MAG: ABC transporter ATP-binding protein [Chloroflexi bacterium]|nr:ABC transporter ATP-binding protein [Chloroflexota bacterium]
MAEQAIYTSNLRKSYGSLQVLRGVDLEVLQGEIWGLLGPNGAGKSTLMHLILGLLKPDDGTIRVFGVEEREQLSTRIGYLPERPHYHNQFTGREYLVTLGRLSGLGGKRLHDRIDTVIDLVGLGPSADRRIGTYSKGMRQRIGLAQAVLHEPDLLIVDEPASGLDPAGQREMGLLLRTLSETGHTIFVCTHQLTEVARLCDRIGVLVGGKITQTSSVAALHEQGHSITIRVTDLPLETANALQALGPEVRYDRLSVTIFPTSDALLAAVLRQLLDDDVAIQAIVPEADALEQFYLNAVHDGQAAASAPAPSTTEDLLETLIEDR